MFYFPGQKPRFRPRNLAASVINSMLAAMPANTFKGNITGVSAAPTDIPRASLRASIFYPSQTTIISSTATTTYTTPTVNGELPLYLRVRMVGGGGGAGGSGTGGSNGTAGGNTTFGSFTANGGANGVNNPGDGVFTVGGGASGGYLNMTGQDGGGAIGGVTASSFGPPGGASFFSGAGSLLVHDSTIAGGGNAAKVNSGSGGGCGGTGSSVTQANAGAAGGYLEGLLSSSPLSTSFSCQIGAKGTGGSAGTSGGAGQNGGDGLIIVEAYWQ